MRGPGPALLVAALLACAPGLRAEKPPVSWLHGAAPAPTKAPRPELEPEPETLEAPLPSCEEELALADRQRNLGHIKKATGKYLDVFYRCGRDTPGLADRLYWLRFVLTREKGPLGSSPASEELVAWMKDLTLPPDGLRRHFTHRMEHFEEAEGRRSKLFLNALLMHAWKQGGNMPLYREALRQSDPTGLAGKAFAYEWAKTLLNIAHFQAKAGAREQARWTALYSLAGTREHLPPDHVHLEVVLDWLMRFHRQAGERELAELYSRERARVLAERGER